jgi:dipeptidyl aminopeptidase/acylaminoacyl peptidase
VNDLVSHGLADPQRVAILGASYGGYAALAGAMATPDLYRAAVSVSGVSDLDEMLSWEKVTYDADNYTYWTHVIGDPKVDGALIKAASPAKHADRIKIPVLLIHGADDDTVPIEQSRMMKAALEHNHKTVKFIRVSMERHGGWSAEHEAMLLNESIAFLRPLLEDAK